MIFKLKMDKKIILIPLVIGGTILMIKLVEAKKPLEELELPEYPVSRVVFIQDKITELASEQTKIPKQELNLLWT